MRNISFILSFLFLGLSLLPCTDGQGLLDNAHHFEQHESNGSLHDHEPTGASHNHEGNGSSHDHEGNCPPFCACQCCGVVLTIAEVEPQPSSFFKPVFLTEFYYSFSYSYHHPTIIWQPPTIA